MAYIQNFLSGLEILGDPHQMLTPDRLHQNDKPYLDHIVKWTMDLISHKDSRNRRSKIKDEIDRRLKLVPPFSGGRYFGNGLDFNQWTASDARQLRKIFVAILYNLGLPDNLLNIHRIETNIGLLIQFRRHDEQSLQELRDNLDGYFKYRQVFDEVRVNEKGKFLGYKLPLKHAREHWPHFISSLGNLVGLSTDLSEYLHIVFVKIPYRRTNRHDVERQICTMSDRAYRLNSLSIWLSAHDHPTLSETSALQRGKKKTRSPIHDEYVKGIRTIFPAKEVAHNSQFRNELKDREDLIQLPFQIAKYLYTQAFPDAPNNQRFDAVKLAPFYVNPEDIAIYRSLTCLFPLPHLPQPRPDGSVPHLKEILRANPNWRPKDDESYRDDSADLYPRFDPALVAFHGTDAADGYNGMEVCRVKLLFKLNWKGTTQELAFVEWYEKEGENGGNEAHSLTGLFKLRKKTKADGLLATSVIRASIII
ncbi:hypothetical protein BT69DRAFT_1333077 [Atractiella rhizophila]|nr:hypothetical protein BT69DRAFT_1333077 [Atractiella rhizophila]